MRYRLDIQDPPAASSGKRYESVEERCNACEIYGGPEKPCLPNGVLAHIEKTRGQKCPRVILDGRNEDAANVLGFLLNSDLSPLVGVLFDAMFADSDAGERFSVLLRVGLAVRDTEVSNALHPKPVLPQR